MRVAIVNDLRIATEALRRVVTSDPGHTVAWTAASGEEGVRRCREDPPDVVLMDLLVPGMNGAEATRQDMHHGPCPILVVTATVAGNFGLVCEALGHGAYDAVATPVLGDAPPAEAGAALLAKRTHVERIRRRQEKAAEAPTVANKRPSAPHTGAGPTWPLVALGASTGGPQALRAVLSQWPAAFPAAVLVAQHISPDFSESLVRWLADGSKLQVRMVRPGDRPAAGVVLVAGTDDHPVLTADLALAGPVRGGPSERHRP